MSKKIEEQNSKSFPANTTPVHSSLPPTEVKQASTTKPTNTTQIGQPGVRRSTGPQTLQGKQRSKYNALKYGIFSNVTILSGESATDYQSLRKRLWGSLQPEGGLEELLLDKLSTISWRYRRMLIAEGAEIRRNSEYPEEISKELPRRLVLGKYHEFDGLIGKVHDTGGLERCVKLLVELHDDINVNGFDQEVDSSLLTEIYGYQKVTTFGRLQSEYWRWLAASEVTKEERAQKGYPTPKECKEMVLRAINSEIARLKQDYEERATAKSERKKIEILRQYVPDSPGLDRLMRYETKLDRAFDRTLAQLERAQSVRKGQPPPPQLDVRIS